MQILGFNKTTLLDYPEHLACTIFLGGCNYRCPFCHNSAFVLSPNKEVEIDKAYVLSYLKKRKNILEGVCITGGEPTLSKDLYTFLEEIKALNLKIKLDSNGSNPHVLYQLISKNMIDYVAMDIKNSLENYSLSTGIHNYDTTPVKESVKIIKNNLKSYEFRTTLVKEHHTLEDIYRIGEWLQGAKSYYLQNFRPSPHTITDGLHSLPLELMKTYQQVLLAYIPHTYLRGV